MEESDDHEGDLGDEEQGNDSNEHQCSAFGISFMKE